MQTSGEQVIFIAGALRSGTTVLRLMLNAHPQMNNPGEIDGLFDHLRRDGAARWRFNLEDARKDWLFRHLELDPGDRAKDIGDGGVLVARFLDKLSIRAGASDGAKASGCETVTSFNIHRNFDKVATLFPDARFVHLLRDPRDVARSSIGMGWAGTVYHGVGHWIESEELWDRATKDTDRNQILEISFEDLIRNPAATLNSICDFFGVPYSDRMLTYDQHTNYAAPDPALVDQWRRNLSPREAALVEFRARDLMVKRGIAFSGAALTPPGLVERIGLRVTDIRKRLALSINRFGLIDTALEVTSRRLGLAGLHDSVQQRIDDKRAKYLK